MVDHRCSGRYSEETADDEEWRLDLHVPVSARLQRSLLLGRSTHAYATCREKGVNNGGYDDQFKIGVTYDLPTKRLRTWETDCGKAIEVVGLWQVLFAHKCEILIHKELKERGMHDEERAGKKCEKCKTCHTEWFRGQKDFLLGVVTRWVEHASVKMNVWLKEAGPTLETSTFVSYKLVTVDKNGSEVDPGYWWWKPVELNLSHWLAWPDKAAG